MGKNDLESTKVIAYYLPQFHEIPENNEWWGEGFTEWTNVRNAKPFYKGQVQPRIPLNNNYYNLLDKSTVAWQTELAKKYGIYGFCYFHYYFKNGKKVLEKPAENLLRWKEIDQNFCFFWANVEWKRTWTAVRGRHVTSWSMDNDQENRDESVLLEQDYGDEKDWKQHFEYLLPFFQDDRYIKIDGKPVFVIYFISYIDKAREMFGVWDELAKQNGFPGLYIMSVNESADDNEYVKGIIHYGSGQVRNSLRFRLLQKKFTLLNEFFSTVNSKYRVQNIMDYKAYWKCILKDKPYGGVQNYPGGTVRYDETPRRGRMGFCLKNDNPQLFERFLVKQIKRGQKAFGTSYIFLNAWNEWGEGSYLEPDIETGYQYLEALKNALDFCNGKNNKI